MVEQRARFSIVAAQRRPVLLTVTLTIQGMFSTSLTPPLSRCMASATPLLVHPHLVILCCNPPAERPVSLHRTAPGTAYCRPALRELNGHFVCTARPFVVCCAGHVYRQIRDVSQHSLGAVREKEKRCTGAGLGPLVLTFMKLSCMLTHTIH